MASIYDFSAKTLQGKEVALADYRDKVLLIVNTASKCGFTPQYEGLEALYETMGKRGLTVLGFPCNQFGKQEPGSAEEIGAFCQMNYGVTFPMFDKIEVNGPNAHPLYDFLKSQQPGLLGTKSIKWNFTKFLVGADGTVFKRYAPSDKPEAIEADLAARL